MPLLVVLRLFASQVSLSRKASSHKHGDKPSNFGQVTVVAAGLRHFDSNATLVNVDVSKEDIMKRTRLG